MSILNWLCKKKKNQSKLKISYFQIMPKKLFWGNLHSWQWFYKTAGRDCRDNIRRWFYLDSNLDSRIWNTLKSSFSANQGESDNGIKRFKFKLLTNREQRFSATLLKSTEDEKCCEKLKSFQIMADASKQIRLYLKDKIFLFSSECSALKV